VLEKGRINRVINDHLGAYQQGIIVRTPGQDPFLSSKTGKSVSDDDRVIYKSTRICIRLLGVDARQRKAIGIIKKTDWKNETVSCEGPALILSLFPPWI
jgi:hypothetical protein